MKSNIKGNGNSKEKDELNVNDLKNKREAVLERNRKAVEVQLEAEGTVDSRAISNALQEKSVVKDEKNNRVLALTDDAVFQLDEKMMKALTITIRNVLDNFKSRVDDDIVNYGNVIETLTYFEFTAAAFVDTKGFRDAKKELFEILKRMKERDDEQYQKMLTKGIVGFFSKSKSNITQGLRKFKNIPYSLNNTIEKEFLRNVFIAEMFGEGIVDYEFLVENGIITNLDFATLDSIYRKDGLLTNEQFENACYLIDEFSSRDEILEYYAENDMKFLVSFATCEELAQKVIEGKIPPKETIKKLRIDTIKNFSPELLEELLGVINFPKGTEFIDFVQEKANVSRVLNKKFLRSLVREQFLKIVLSDKIKYQNPYKSEDYINSYGIIFSDDIIALQEKGLINPEDVIKLTQFDSMKVQNPEEYNRMIEDQLSFYNFDRLESMLKENRINGKFVENFNEFLNNKLSEEQRKKYLEELSKALNQKSGVDENLVLLVKKGITFNGELNYRVPEEVVSDMFLDEKITDTDMVRLYENKLLSIDEMRSLFSNNELLELYNAGKMDYRILNFLENREEIIKSELESKRLTPAELMELYSMSDGIDIEEFLHIVENYNLENENLGEYLTDDITPEKVESLFNKYYISHDDLTYLVGRNVITKEDAEKFEKNMLTHEAYESIFSLNNRYVHLTKDSSGTGNGGGYHPGFGPTGGRASQIKNDPELQELLLEQVGFDERTLFLTGTNNSLDGYKVFPSEEYGLMVFLKGDKAGNATYIMSLQQGMYFLNKMIRDRENSEETADVQIESDATKQDLRQTPHIKIRNAAPGWGKNVISDMESLSPTLKAKRRKDSDYKKVLDDIVEEIREDYIERKNMVRE